MIGPNCSVILAAGITELTRLALLSFPTSPSDPSKELMGRNLISHVRSNMYFKVLRSALDPGNTLPSLLQTGALLVRGTAPQGKFQIQVTASADMGGNSDALLYAMIPDIDQLDALLASQQAGWISFAFRGASQLTGDMATSVPDQSGRWINLSPFESDEFGIPRAYVQFTTSAAEEICGYYGSLHGGAGTGAVKRQRGQPADEQPRAGPSWLDLSRGRHALDGDRSSPRPSRTRTAASITSQTPIARIRPFSSQSVRSIQRSPA